jgi:acyl-CoA synthetase (AMP-forming)/AMP-acid ligase II/1-acyl-sn-glycerol-3-phosphate acyltransferase/acyl carrier protein
MKGALLTRIGRALLSLRYKVRIEGLETILAKGSQGILILPNHPAYIDPAILLTHFFPALQPHILADKDNMGRPGIRWVVGRLGIKPIPDPALHGEKAVAEVAQVLQGAVEDLRRGENYLLYPAGHIYLGRYEDLGANSAVESILSQAPEVRVVLVRTTGLWGSSWSKAETAQPDLAKCLLHGLRALLASLIFFGPRREVRIEVVEPPDFPRDQDRLVQNRYLEAFYNQGAPPAWYVPYTPWERGGARELAERQVQRMEGDLNEVPDSVREAFQAKLADLAGGRDFPDTADLARDLGMDSLARLELKLWMEQEFGHEAPDPEALRTVGDCLLAACGKAVAIAQPALKPPAPGWFAPRPSFAVPEGDTIQEVFLRQAARSPGASALADLQGGRRTYRDLVTGILVLRPRIEALEGERVGILLPASGAAAVAYLSVLFAGKVPVMVNWTAGARNIVHGLDLLGVKRVISSSQLVAKVESMGTDLSAIRDRFWMLEDLAPTLSLGDKLGAFLKARFSWGSLRRVRGPETAVILFTSGSESLPKAVPLTHRNLLTNVRDLGQVFPFQSEDRLIGFLPPFHSFGLTGTVLLPLCSGLPVVYFPNPTDGGTLARLVEAYRVTVLVGTPTFLSSIVRSATDAQLASLRMAVAGAEKCPESLFQVLAKRWPGLRVLEGYGITECSPVLSVNAFQEPRLGTIGKALPSVEHRIINADSGLPVEPGQTGMLLVRGPSIFGGYLHHEGASPFVEFEGQPWYRTGDLVREDAHGSLVFMGRLKRFVKLGGEMVSLPAIEEVLLRRFAREEDTEIPLAVEATPSEDQPELVLFSLRGIGREEANDALRQAGLSPLHFIRKTRQIEHIPVLGTGKTDYRSLKTMLE